MKSFQRTTRSCSKGMLAACGLTAIILLGALPFPCNADVLYVYDVQSQEFLMGEKKTELKIGYGPQMMVMDVNTSFTGSWMKRLFGKVKQERSTTLILLEEEQIRDVDWENAKLSILPIDQLADLSWVQEKAATDPQIEAALKERYQVIEPQLTVHRNPEPEMVDGYTCHRVDAALRLESRDTIKRASSVTHVKQQLWLTEEIAGYGDRQRVHERLASRLGIGAERIGSLNFLLRHWPGSDEPIEDLVRQANGVSIKSVMTIDAEYTTGMDTPNPKTITKRLKDESTRLKEVREEPLERSAFDAPPQFKTVVVQ